MNPTDRVYCIRLACPYRELGEKAREDMAHVLGGEPHMTTGTLAYVFSPLPDAEFRAALCRLPFVAD